MMEWMLIGLFAFILSYLGWGVLYQFIFSVAGLFWKDAELPPVSRQRKMAVFIPAYKEDNVIVKVAKDALEQDYPADQYEVFVIADSFQESTLEELKQLPIQVVEVSFEKSTKSRALNATLAQLSKSVFEVMVILDADNIMAPDFLAKINSHFELGHRVVQGCRAAKNHNTPMAILDGLSEAINNHILCKGHAALGLSARLAGSGMAFDASLFQRTMPKVDAIGGFDKELELQLIGNGEQVFYAPEAVVYDEKVSKPAHFSQQRSRWIAAQFHYAKRFVPHAFRTFFVAGNIDYLNKAIQMLLPPRLITPGVLGIMGVLSMLLGHISLAIGFFSFLLINIGSFLLAMPAYAWRPPYINAFLQLPMIFVFALKSLLSIGKAKQQFIHTPHGETLNQTK